MMKHFLVITICLILLYQISFESINAEIKFSRKDLQALNKFRPRIRDVLNTTDYTSSSEFLITWIKDRDYDLAKAEEKLRKSLQWRRENEIDKLLDDKTLSSLEHSFPYDYLGVDKEESPTFGLQFGKWDIRKYAIGGHLDLPKKELFSIFEKGQKFVRDSVKNGKDVSQWNLISNLAGFNSREHTCLACLPFYLEITTAFENNYPLSVKHIAVINSPQIFDHILRIVKPLLSSNSLNALKVFSVDKTEYQPFLESFLDLHKLSVEYGGLAHHE